MTLVNLPKTVQIGPYTVNVEVVETADNGQFLLEDQRILISPAQKHDSTADTLLHEVLHGLFVTAGLRKHVVSEKVEEQLISALTPQLLDTLRRNPKLVTFLTDAKTTG